MTPHSLVVVGLRLFAILLFVSAIGLLLTQVMGRSDEAWIGIGVALAQLAVCTAAWFFPSTIAKKLLPSSKDEVVDASPAAPDTWLAVGTIAIGLWLLTSAASESIYWAIFLAVASFDAASELDANAKASMGMLFVEFALGIWLVVGGKGIAQFVWKLRTGGVAKS